MNDENEAISKSVKHIDNPNEEVQASKFMMAIYKKMEIFTQNNKVEQETILKKTQDIANEMQKNCLRQEIHFREAIEKIEIELNSTVSKMETIFTAQNRAPGKRLGKTLAMVAASSIVGGIISGLTVHHFIPEVNADMRHQLVAGKMLQASWNTLTKADQDKIIAIGFGAAEPRKDKPAESVAKAKNSRSS